MTRFLLGFDTSSDEVIISLATGAGAVVDTRAVPARRLANAKLLTEIDELLHEHGVLLTQLEAIIVGCGPGSFTGVRIGVATAKGLAYGLGIPLFGISTTDAALWGMWVEGQRGEVTLAFDAMRGEVYPVQALLADEGVQRNRADYVTKRSDHKIDDAAVFSIGRGLIESYLRGDILSTTGLPQDVLPLYTRLSDAEETARENAGQPTGAELMAQGKMSLSGVDEGAPENRMRWVRRLVTGDIPELSHLESQVFEDVRHPWSRQQFIEEFTQENRLWLGMFQRDVLVGYVGLSSVDETADLLRIGVMRSVRREGIASRLLNTAVQILMPRGISRIMLEARDENKDARAFYEAYGFTHIATRDKYFLFPEGSEDVLVMECKLNEGVATDEKVKPQESDMQQEALSVHGSPEGLLGTPFNKEPLVLGIETSCDETAAAVLEGFDIKSNVIASQVQWHARFGGVVPEIASRKHIEAIVTVVDEALAETPCSLADLDAIAVTVKPGLVGALVVGLAFAKGLSYATDIALYGINHLEGHIIANKLDEEALEPPFVSLIVSGGNTSLVFCDTWGRYTTLGETLDDATGEAFDKVAKVLDLGYPGGPVISRLAQEGDPAAIDFPRAMMHTKDYKFSLSGLKTAVITYIHQQREQGAELNLPDIAASFQQAIIDVQVHKAVRAVKETGAQWFCLAGGVAANKALREALTEAMTAIGVRVSVPPFSLCGDNAAMIAGACLYHVDSESPLGLDAEASANASFDD